MSSGKFDITAAGMLYCDIPVALPQDSFCVDSINCTTGGDALNVATTAAKLGMSAAVVGFVGDDCFGNEIIHSCVRNGVDASYIHKDRPGTSPVAIHIIGGDGGGDDYVSGKDKEKRIGQGHIVLDAHPLKNRISSEMVPDALLKESGIVYFGSALTYPQMDRGGTRQLFMRAHAAGAITAMDTFLYARNEYKSPDDIIDDIMPALTETDIFIPSLQEIEWLSGGVSDPHEIALYFKDCGFTVFGVKMGAKGSYFTDYHDEFHVAPYSYKKVVDTTGAGDSFFGSFLTAFSKGNSIEESAAFASAVAAFNISEYGATAGVPDHDTVTAFLSTKPAEIRRRKF